MWDIPPQLNIWNECRSETFTWISLYAEQFTNQLLELSPHLPHCGARGHRQMVQPGRLQDRNTDRQPTTFHFIMNYPNI